jgi:hypothetical protein
MVMKKIIFILFIGFIFQQSAFADVSGKYIFGQYKNKQYKAIAQTFVNNPSNRIYFKNANVMAISAYSTEKNLYYQESIILYYRIIKLNYLKTHLYLLKKLKNNGEVDSDRIPKKLKVIYFSILRNYSKKIFEVTKSKDINSKDVDAFAKFKDILTLIEHDEGKVDKLSDKVTAHNQKLFAKDYKKSVQLVFNYLSWTRQVTLETIGGDFPLQITNSAICAGGAYGWENDYYHFFADGCVVVGSGTVSSQSTTISYEQSSVQLAGIKLGLGAGKFVSTTKSELGVKISALGISQVIAAPPTTYPACNPGCSISGNSMVTSTASLYSRWPFGSYFVETEFGKFITHDNSLWVLGFGYKF